MKSLLFKISGPSSSDCTVMLVDLGVNDLVTGELFREIKCTTLGLIQSFTFQALVQDLYSDLTVSMKGLCPVSGTVSLEENDVFILAVDYIGRNPHTTFNTYLGMIKDGKIQLFAAVQKLLLSANAETNNLTLELDILKSVNINYSGFYNWVLNVPGYVTINQINIDELQELGTDGIIDRISCRKNWTTS